MICTSRPSSLRIKLHVVVAGHAKRRPGRAPSPSRAAACPTIAARDRPDRRGRSPCVPPGGVHARPSVRARSRASPSSSSSSSKQPWTSPMMSNGRVVLAVVPQRLALDRRRRRPPPASSARGRGGSLRAQPAQRTVQLLSDCARHAARSRDPGGDWLRSWQTPLRQVEHDRDRQHVILRASATSGLRALGLDVGGVDDGEPSALRAARPRRNAAPRRHRRSPPGRSRRRRPAPRQKSDDSTSVGLKCFRANVDLPQPDGPISDDQREFGDGERHRREHRHLRRRDRPRVLVADAQKRDGVADGEATPSAQAWNSARVHSKR